MAQEGKKISFGFSKIIKKPELIVSKTSGEKKIDYIEYVDDKSIKVMGEDKKKVGSLIIPMLDSKTWHDRILNKINADIYREKKDGKDDSKKEIKIKTEPTESNDNESTEKSKNIIKIEEPLDPLLFLEDQAAQEIIRDLKKEEEAQENSVNLVIEQTLNLIGKKEPTLENYEEIPIEQYGMAMLRGMGWEPGRGIGKNAQIVKAVTPKLRAKGIGLGADKVMQQNKATQNQSNNSEKLKLEKGCFLKITAGNLSGNYGIVEGFDDDSGRIIVKLTLTHKTVSLNDVIVEPVTKDVYEKSSRVLNAAMYEKYKNKIVDEKIMQKRNRKRSKSSSEVSENNEQEQSDKQTNYKTSKKNQTSKDRERYSSSSENEDSSNSDEKRTKSTRSNDRFENYKFKKSKKHRHRDHSESSRTKKNHKKNKNREKSEKYKDEKKKHRKHKRSCSKSQSRFSRR